MDEDLKEAYYNLKESNIAYTSVKKLVQAFKSKYDAKKIVSWAKNQENLNLHKPMRKKFERNFMLCHYPFQFISIDLADLSLFKDTNDNFRYVISCVDCFSKLGFVEFLKSKKSEEVSIKLENIIKKIDAPIDYCISDGGLEFAGQCKKIYTKYNIKHIIMLNETKAAQAEIFIRTWKRVLFRYMTENGTNKYIDVLPTIVENYNKTTHSVTKFSPNELRSNLAIQKKGFINMFSKKLVKKFRAPTYRVGQLIRISYQKSPFAKSYEQTFSNELFRIKKIYHKRIPVYQLETFDGKTIIDGLFYEQQITEGQERDFYKIEKVLRYKHIRKRKFALVKWVGWPDSYNEWLPYDQIKDII